MIDLLNLLDNLGITYMYQNGMHSLSYPDNGDLFGINKESVVSWDNEDMKDYDDLYGWIIFVLDIEYDFTEIIKWKAEKISAQNKSH